MANELTYLIEKLSKYLMTNKIIHVAPVLPPDEHQIEYALDSAGHQGTLVTSWIPTTFEYAMLRNLPVFRKRLRREPVRLRLRKADRHAWPDIRRFIDINLRTYPSTLLAHDAFFERVDRHAQKLISSETRVVIGREFGCRLAFLRARENGVSCVYHLPTVHHETLREILGREQELFSDVCRSTFDPFEFQGERLLNKRAEIDMADAILCPSKFVEQSLLKEGIEAAKIKVAPFGGEAAWLDVPRAQGTSPTFVFVGNISARKGAHRLLQVWKQLQAYRTHKLLLVGEMHLKPSFLRNYSGLYEHLPRMPREDLRDIYLRASALVLPALAEGFALVIQEALSCGTPVLASQNSGAAGFLNDEQARLFKAQDNDSLATSLEWALTHPAELAAMGEAGRLKARQWSWRSFKRAVQNEINVFAP
ncbi:MAG: glycosyltransferase [Prosthecobacter sp.]|nr:glycosyltransferase [Prosthecobacter sp.]